jgi:hypothetical protein
MLAQLFMAGHILLCLKSYKLASIDLSVLITLKLVILFVNCLTQSMAQYDMMKDNICL